MEKLIITTTLAIATIVFAGNSVTAQNHMTTTNQKLISGADLGGALVLELDYEIPQPRSSSADMMGKPSGTYTQTVTYTATAL